MNEFKLTLLCSLLLKAIYIICVTIAAIYFQRYGLLWFYPLVLLLGWEYRENKKE